MVTKSLKRNAAKTKLNIPSLPTELLLTILKYSGGPRDLACERVSKTFGAIVRVETLQYATFARLSLDFMVKIMQHVSYSKNKRTQNCFHWLCCGAMGGGGL